MQSIYNPGEMKIQYNPQKDNLYNILWTFLLKFTQTQQNNIMASYPEGDHKH